MHAQLVAGGKRLLDPLSLSDCAGIAEAGDSSCLVLVEDLEAPQ